MEAEKVIELLLQVQGDIRGLKKEVREVQAGVRETSLDLSGLKLEQKCAQREQDRNHERTLSAVAAVERLAREEVGEMARHVRTMVVRVAQPHDL
jgi:uncharacterized coiled-coil DUF342 family protein